MGLMPHPEHAVDPLLGSGDGALILASLVDAARERSLRARPRPRRLGISCVSATGGVRPSASARPRRAPSSVAQTLEVARSQGDGPRRTLPPVE